MWIVNKTGWLYDCPLRLSQSTPLFSSNAMSDSYYYFFSPSVLFSSFPTSSHASCKIQLVLCYITLAHTSYLELCAMQVCNAPIKSDDQHQRIVNGNEVQAAEMPVRVLWKHRNHLVMFFKGCCSDWPRIATLIVELWLYSFRRLMRAKEVVPVIQPL